MTILNGQERNRVYLICGVSGSGKTWVCQQLMHKYHYVPHDEFYASQAKTVADRSSPHHTVITECPFGERLIRDEMENKYNLEVTPLFVITHPDTAARQYYQREGRYISKSAYTRASSIIKRAQEWGAFYGSAAEVLQHLREA